MKKVVLLVLDGYGYNEDDYGNAIKAAKTPNFDMLWNKYPHSLLEACGMLVGLPKGGLGGSEVGHMNMGAGRIVYQPLALIDKHIEDGEFFQNPVLIEAMNHVKKNNSRLHLFGMLSDYGIHSMDYHLFALLKMAKENGVKDVYLHICTDGRDAQPKTSPDYFKRLYEEMDKYGIGKVASVGGRYYAMDRDNKWDRVKLGYDAMVFAKGKKYDTVFEGIEASYNEGVTDEFIVPFVVDEAGAFEDNDAFINFNYRKDREVEIMKALTREDFSEFPVRKFDNLYGATFMFVTEQVKAPYAFRIDELTNTLGEYLASQKIWQLRLAETEKYVYVTSVFDAMNEEKLDCCDQILIPSPKVATFDLKPEMSVYEVTDAFLQKMDEEKYQIIIMNFANPDMVGHTGVFEAAVEAINHVDICLGKVYDKVMEKGSTLVVVADHGNADVMLDEKGEVVTSHSFNKAPFILCDENMVVKDGKLADIGPTLLSLLELDIPSEMTGDVLYECMK